MTLLPTKPLLERASKPLVCAGPGIYRWVVDLRFLGKDIILRCPADGHWFFKELDEVVWRPLTNPETHEYASASAILPSDAIRFYKRQAGLARSYKSAKHQLEKHHTC